MELIEKMVVPKSKAKGFISRLKEIADCDVVYSFKSSKVTIFATLLLVFLLIIGLGAQSLALYNPLDIQAFDLFDSELPPIWSEGGDSRFILGTDIQGRDVLSLIMYGLKTSLLVGFISVILSMLIGVSLGIISGFKGGKIDALIMRVADAMLSFPTIMFALLVSGIARSVFPKEMHNDVAVYVIILSITLTGWMQYARTVRGATRLESQKEYVQASKVMGSSSIRIMFKHILPNVVSPVLVLCTLHLALAVLTEATLSFLGVGMPPNLPSLGTLINEGNQYLFSGQWWVVLFPSVTLVLLALSVNLVGDWLRNVLNPKLR